MSAERDLWQEGITRPKRVCLGLSILGVIGFVFEFAKHDFFHLACYALIAASGLCTYALLEGMAYGYRDGRRTVDAERQAVADAVVDTIEADLRAARTPREIAREFPVAFPGEGFLYVLKFSTGGVKVGQTVDLRRRLTEHRRDADAYGVVISDYWVSPSHTNYLGNEIELIGFCDGVCTTRGKREYFHGVEYGEVVRFAAKSLVYYTGAQIAMGVDR